MVMSDHQLKKKCTWKTKSPDSTDRPLKYLAAIGNRSNVLLPVEGQLLAHRTDVIKALFSWDSGCGTSGRAMGICLGRPGLDPGTG